MLVSPYVLFIVLNNGGSLFDRNSLSYIHSGIELLSGSNQPHITASNDDNREMETDPDAGRTTQTVQTTIGTPLSTKIRIVGNDQMDDPYGIFEPIVHETNLDGTFIYFCSHFNFFSKPIMFDQFITS
jgi:hypothetical protein